MKKKLTTIKEFINQSIGEWKSIRSTHSLAFQEFENTNSIIKISYFDNDQTIKNVINQFNNNLKIQTCFSVNISWRAESSWSTDNSKKTNQTLLIFSPRDIRSGIIFRDKGYAESIHSTSEYILDDNSELNIITTYSETLSEERIWFLSENVRSRYSVVKNKTHNSILQTSLSTEIRKIINQEG